MRFSQRASYCSQLIKINTAGKVNYTAVHTAGRLICSSAFGCTDQLPPNYCRNTAGSAVSEWNFLYLRSEATEAGQGS